MREIGGSRSFSFLFLKNIKQILLLLWNGVFVQLSLLCSFINPMFGWNLLPNFPKKDFWKHLARTTLKLSLIVKLSKIIVTVTVIVRITDSIGTDMQRKNKYRISFYINLICLQIPPCLVKLWLQYFSLCTMYEKGKNGVFLMIWEYS